MIYDVIIIGGGPAGLSAGLTLGRAKRKTLIISEDNPRNAVTHETHGFLTNDSISPKELYKKAQRDIQKYPTIFKRNDRVEHLYQEEQIFKVMTINKDIYFSKKLIIATGLKDKLPNIENFESFYGKSIFPCPFCDGWEHKERKLAVFSSQEHTYEYLKMISSWNKDLILFTDGKSPLREKEHRILSSEGIKIVEQKIKKLNGTDGILESVELEDGSLYLRNAGFIKGEVFMDHDFAKDLNLETYDGVIETTPEGKTSCEGVYLAGDVRMNNGYQIAIAVYQGSTVGAMIHMELTNEYYKSIENKLEE